MTGGPARGRQLTPTPASAGVPPIRARPGGWPTRRAPRALILAGVVVLAAAVAVGLAHRPSRQERAADLHSFLYAVTYDIDSCAGGVHDSLSALQQVEAGAAREAATAQTIAGNGAADCSPANNELIDDLENYEVPESLAQFHLQAVVSGLIDWAEPDAGQVEAAVSDVLAARGTGAEGADQAALRRALRVLDAQRAAVSRELAPAIRALDPAARPLGLPG